MDIEKNEVKHFQVNFNVEKFPSHKDVLDELKIKYENLKTFNEFTEEEQKVFLDMLRK